MEYISELFERLDIKMYKDSEEIDFSTLCRMEKIDIEKRKSDTRCRGHYKTSGERCRRKVKGYCDKHKKQEMKVKVSLPLVEVEYKESKNKSELECKNIVIDNLIYNVYVESREVYRNNVYIGKYDGETKSIVERVLY
jgi:hypothetical protein